MIMKTNSKNIIRPCFLVVFKKQQLLVLLFVPGSYNPLLTRKNRVHIGWYTHLSIINIMNFIKYHPLYVPNESRTTIQHGSQNLCCHDETVSISVDLNISSDESNTVKLFFKLTKLLVR